MEHKFGERDKLEMPITKLSNIINLLLFINFNIYSN